MAKLRSILKYLYNLCFIFFIFFVPFNAISFFYTYFHTTLHLNYHAMLCLSCVKAKHISSAGEKRCEVMSREWSSSRFQLFESLVFEGGLYNDISSKQ